MVTDTRLQAAKKVLDTYRLQLLNVPGVVSVEIGAESNEPVIRVGLTPWAGQVPQALSGVKISQRVCDIEPEFLVSMGSRINTKVGYGSAGFFTTFDGKPYLITCAHLWPDDAREGDALYATGKPIGRLERWVPFNSTVESDMSAVVVQNPSLINPTIVRAGGPIGIRRPRLGARVWKFGSTSGTSSGIVTGLYGSTFYPRTNAVVHNLFTVTDMTTRPGDSGGPVFEADGTVVGLISGGNGVAYCTDAVEGLSLLRFSTNTRLMTSGAPFRTPATRSDLWKLLLLPAIVGGVVYIVNKRR